MAGDLIVISAGLIMVRVVGVELAESSVGVKATRAIAIDLAKMLVGFIVIN